MTRDEMSGVARAAWSRLRIWSLTRRHVNTALPGVRSLIVRSRVGQIVRASLDCGLSVAQVHWSDLCTDYGVRRTLEILYR